MSSFALDKEVGVLVGAVAAMAAANVLVLRRLGQELTVVLLGLARVQSRFGGREVRLDVPLEGVL